MINRRGTLFGVAKRVSDPLCSDRLLVVAGVADQRPARAERNPQVVGYGTAEERCLAPRGPDASRKLRHEVQCAVVVALDIGLVGTRLGVGPAHHEHRQAVVGGCVSESAKRPNVDFEAIYWQFTEIAVEGPLQTRLSR